MSDYIIATSSTSDLPRTWLDAHGIPFIPYSFTVNGSPCEDDCREESRAAIYRGMRGGDILKTSMINEFVYHDFFRRLLDSGKDVIFLDMSKEMSVSFSNATKAAAAIREEYPEQRLYVMDTFCISGGLSQAEAYSLSDYYIRLADAAATPEEISEIHNEMCLHYAKQMYVLQRSAITSKAVTTAINYIYEHLHTRITLASLASVTNLLPSYLSRIFKKETGYSVSDYILGKKLETAKSMLASSDYQIAEISASLAFPSQSYFTNLLKKDCGMTPREYRMHNRNNDYNLRKILQK